VWADCREGVCGLAADRRARIVEGWNELRNGTARYELGERPDRIREGAVVFEASE
jgi:hypothetical protein